MSRRVLVKGDIGQAVGTVAGAQKGAAAGAALGSVVPGIGTLIGGIAGGLLGAKTGGKVGDALTGGENITEKNNQKDESFTDKIKERGKQAIEFGQQQAQLAQQKQSQMQQQNMQMAEKAKQGSQINTGEPMDMSWQLLKDMYFNSQFQTPEYAQARQRIIDEAIENMQRQQYFDEQNHAKIRAGMVEGLRPNDRNEYQDERGKWINARHPSDYMYDQEHSDQKKFPGMYNIPAHQMLNAVGSFIDFNDLPDWEEDKSKKVRAIVPQLFQRKKDGWQSKQLENYLPVLQDEFSEPSLRTTLNEEMSERPGAKTVSPYRFMHRNLNRKDDMLALTQEKLKQERKEREERRLAREAEAEEERMNELKASALEDNKKRLEEIKRLNAQKRKTEEEAKLEMEKRKNDILEEESRQERENFLDTDEGKAVAAKFSQFMGRPNMHAYNDGEREQMISQKILRRLPVMERAVYNQLVKRGILKSSPMDMAWRMMKGELQLPHQITDTLKDDILTLDRAHKMTDTNEGTLIENIHPDMENVIKLLAEKHMGDLTPNKTRPVMPLFHGQFD